MKLIKKIPNNLIHIVGIIVLAAFLGLFYYFFLKTPVQSVDHENQNQNIESRKTGAIYTARALTLERHEEEALETEAEELLGSRMSFYYDKASYLEFRERVFANKQLAITLQSANKEEVVIALRNKFEVGTGIISINVNVPDEEIIKFLSTENISVARTKEINFQELQREAFQYGIKLSSGDLEKYEQLRSHFNRRLVSAFEVAKIANVSIFLGNEFGVGSGWVKIDVSAPDEKIIKFLLGG